MVLLLGESVTLGIFRVDRIPINMRLVTLKSVVGAYYHTWKVLMFKTMSVQFFFLPWK